MEFFSKGLWSSVSFERSGGYSRSFIEVWLMELMASHIPINANCPYLTL
jgi:hypothetical protein